MTMLFDFFGDLLTEKQRDYFDLYHNEDLTLSEIAGMAGISRQGVYDIITRAESTLAEFERKTGVVQRWGEMRTELEHAEALAQEVLRRLGDDEQSVDLAKKLVDALARLASRV